MITKPIILKYNEKQEYEHKTYMFALIAMKVSYEGRVGVRIEKNVRTVSIWTTFGKAQKAMKRFKNAEEEQRVKEGKPRRFGNKTELRIVRVELNENPKSPLAESFWTNMCISK